MFLFTTWTSVFQCCLATGKSWWWRCKEWQHLPLCTAGTLKRVWEERGGACAGGTSGKEQWSIWTPAAFGEQWQPAGRSEMLNSRTENVTWRSRWNSTLRTRMLVRGQNGSARASERSSSIRRMGSGDYRPGGNCGCRWTSTPEARRRTRGRERKEAVSSGPGRSDAYGCNRARLAARKRGWKRKNKRVGENGGRPRGLSCRPLLSHCSLPRTPRILFQPLCKARQQTTLLSSDWTTWTWKASPFLLH